MLKTPSFRQECRRHRPKRSFLLHKSAKGTDQISLSIKQECLRHLLLDKSAESTDPRGHLYQTRVPMALTQSVIFIRQECLRHLLLDKSAEVTDPSGHFY